MVLYYLTYKIVNLQVSRMRAINNTPELFGFWNKIIINYLLLLILNETILILVILNVKIYFKCFQL